MMSTMMSKEHEMLAVKQVETGQVLTQLAWLLQMLKWSCKSLGLRESYEAVGRNSN
jgi:hypothetical protein